MTTVRVRTQRTEDHRVALPRDSARAQGGLATVLALISGYVDSYVFWNYKVFASFMSGNTTLTGMQAGQANFAEAGHNILPIPLFVVGVFAGTFLGHSSLRHQLRRQMGLVAALLAVDMAANYFGPLPGWFSIILLSLAMGILNTTITRVGGQAVSLGFVSGDLNNLARHLALAVQGVPVPQAESSRDTHLQRAALLAGVWAAFLFGALLAGTVTALFAAWTLLLPTLVLLVLAAFDRDTNGRKGFVDVSS
jgi:uncharacterized membrane protein YoaK (UPF0700 family)